MIIETASIITAIKTVADMVRGLNDNRTESAVQEKTSEIMRHLLDLQTFCFEFSEKHQELAEKYRLLHDHQDHWNNEVRPHYRLKAIADNVFVYAFDPQSSQADKPHDPQHYICAHCYQSQVKSILQHVSNRLRGKIYKCFACNLEICEHTDSPASGTHQVEYDPWGRV